MTITATRRRTTTVNTGGLDRDLPPVSRRRDLACSPDDNPDFYPEPSGKRPATRAKRKAAAEARAVALCGRCPARQECLAWALATRQPYGIWGGLNANQRTRLLTALKSTTAQAS